MKSRSYALVVGLDNYPSFSPLQGSANDARSFLDWLLDESPRGGRLPRENVLAFIDDGTDAAPDFQSIKGALRRQIGLEALQKGEEGIRDRLYVYFAGHGITVEQPGLSQHHRTAFLGLECDHYDYTSQIAACILQEAVESLDYYREVLLIMDCCRDIRSSARVMDFWGLNLLRKFEDGRYPQFFAMYAAKVGQKAREYRGADGRYRGYFTEALVRNLRAAVDAQGRVTFASLSNAMHNDLPEPSPQFVAADSQASLVFSEEGVVLPSSLTLDFSELQGRPGQLHIYHPSKGLALLSLASDENPVVLEELGLYTIVLQCSDPLSGLPLLRKHEVKLCAGMKLCLALTEEEVLHD